MQTLLHDLRYTFRQLQSAPGFAALAILTLAFGIGATTAIFSVVEGVLLRPLPFRQPDRLLVLTNTIEGAGSEIPGVTAPEIPAYKRGIQAFFSLFGYQQTFYELSGGGDPAQINASRLGASAFSVLGVSPELGRPFTEQEDTDGQHVAVLSYQLWQSRFHGSTTVLGQTILLDRMPYRIIGVMPRSFEFPLVPGQLNRSELWVPLSLTPSELGQGTSNWNFRLVGRLKPRRNVAQAQQEAEGVTREIVHNLPATMASLRIHAVLEPLQEATVSQARPLVHTLFLAVTVVLFIACANLAGLLLVRVIRRRREIAVRLALGASGAAVLRQTLIETLSLSLTGGLLGLGLAILALHVGVGLLPETLPRINSIGIDWQVAAFALLLAVFTGLACGVVPAFAASRTGLNEALKEGGRTGTSGSAHARVRSALVIAEISVALVLLVAAGLLLRSFERIRSVDLGLRADHALTAAYSLPRQHYSTQATVDRFNENLLHKLEQIPSVTAVGLTGILPAVGQSNSGGFVAEDFVPSKGAGLNLCWPSQIMGSYFQAAGIRLLRGRDFTAADRLGAPLVIMVNQTLAEHYWPGRDPVGKRIHWGLPESPLPWMTIVGEIADVKQTTADTETQPQIYQPASQAAKSYGAFAPPDMLNGNGGFIVLRALLPPEKLQEALSRAVRSLDPQLPLTQVGPMERIIEEGQAPRRFNTALISSFAIAAVLLTLLGIYSVIAFSAALRTQEMAIRMALGSQRSSIMRLILVSGGKLCLIGCGIGTVLAVFATRLLRSFLFQVDALDPAIIVAAALSIFLLALAASLIPARRAAQVDLIQSLRTE